MTTASALSRRQRAALLATLVTAAAAFVFVLAQAPNAISASTFATPAGPVSTAQERGEAAADGRITAADGQIEPGSALSLYDGSPAVAGLDGALLDAVRNAGAAAVEDGVELRVNSGWRSAELQDHLLQEAVGKYGSVEEASRWVATAETSEHVSGHAIDIGPWEGAEWLGRNGAAFGLCQIYENEPWHFELRPDARTEGCPRMYRDPTER